MACYFLVQAQMLLARRAGERLLMVCSVVRGLGLCQIIYRFRQGGFGFDLGPAKSGAFSSIPATPLLPAALAFVSFGFVLVRVLLARWLLPWLLL
jgi:hypothetical protein